MCSISQHWHQRHPRRAGVGIYPNTCVIYPKCTHQCYRNTSLTQALTPPKSTSSCKDMPLLFKNALRIHFVSARQDQREPFYISSWHPSRVGKQKFSGKMGREMGAGEPSFPSTQGGSSGRQNLCPKVTCCVPGDPSAEFEERSSHLSLSPGPQILLHTKCEQHQLLWRLGQWSRRKSHLPLAMTQLDWEGEPHWEYPHKN